MTKPPWKNTAKPSPWTTGLVGRCFAHFDPDRTVQHQGIVRADITDTSTSPSTSTGSSAIPRPYTDPRKGHPIPLNLKLPPPRTNSSSTMPAKTIK